MKTLFRYHRGGLTESMATTIEIESKKELISILNKNIFGTDFENITIEPYCFDSRINWDTYIVHLEDYGVIGFTNGELR